MITVSRITTVKIIQNRNKNVITSNAIWNSGPALTTQDVETPTESGPLTNAETNSKNADDETSESGLTATDLYDLTMTAIAFLGFGTFVMNLIMDAVNVNIIVHVLDICLTHLCSHGDISGSTGGDAINQLFSGVRCHRG